MIALLATAWVVSDNPAGSPTGWAAPSFIAAGLVAGGLAPALVDLQESSAAAGRHLVVAALTHLAPFGLAVWGTAAWLEGTAYAYLVPWCWGAWGLAAAIACIGALARIKR